MNKPLVSVCVLAYNHEAYIRECLNAILEQSVDFNWEIIISDDYSADNTRSILEEYQAKHPMLIKLLFLPKNGGVIDSLTNLLSASNGKYIAFCEGDDYWLDPLKLKKQVAVLENNSSYSMVCSNRQILKLDGTLVNDQAYTKTEYTIKDIIDGFIPGTQTMMIRNYASLVDFFKKYKLVYSGDRYLSYFCTLFGDVFRLQDITAVYRDTGNGVWSSFTAVKKTMLLTTQMLEFHQSLGIPIQNEVLAKKSFSGSWNIFLYCLKRPKLFLSKEYVSYIWMPFKKFYKMQRIRFLFSAIANRIKGI